MNDVIREIVRSGRVTDEQGHAYEPVSAVTLESGELLYDFVRNFKPERTLETGMAFGLSTLFICQALEDNGSGTHTAIDPLEESEFKSIGVLNLRRAQLDRRFRLFQAPSDVVLPRLCEEGAGPIDFAFIDGWHLFDFTLVDFYYIDKLLRVGGHVAFDDLWMPSVRKVVSFVLKNKPYSLVRLPARNPAPAWRRTVRIARRIAQGPLARDWRVKLLPDNVAFLEKTAADGRPWDFHRAF
jgi:predicted O-methyltransferase YrrM